MPHLHKVQKLRKDEYLAVTIRVLLRQALTEYNLEDGEQEGGLQ